MANGTWLGNVCYVVDRCRIDLTSNDEADTSQEFGVMWLTRAIQALLPAGLIADFACALCAVAPVAAQPLSPGGGTNSSARPSALVPAAQRGAAATDHATTSIDRPQIAAATAMAIDNLRDDISREQLTSRMTVGEFLRRTHGEDVLLRELNRAELIGGARWLDEQTCQVQVQISGTRVTHALQQIAASTKDSPLTPPQMGDLTADWRRRVFGATGSSTAFSHIAAARPRHAADAWINVSDTERARTLAAAKDDAINRVLSSVRSISIGHDSTMADALAVKDIEAAMIDWLANRPVIGVTYRRDLQIELTMAGTPDGLYEVARRALEKHPELKLPQREVDWSRMRIAFEDRMDQPVGRSTASVIVVPGAPAQAAPPRQTLQLPMGTPRWASRQIAAVATSLAGSSKLKAARAAESAARIALMEKINALPLSAAQTVGEAAQKDPRVADAINRTVEGARVVKTDYYHGENVEVEMSLDLRELWERLRVLQW